MNLPAFTRALAWIALAALASGCSSPETATGCVTSLDLTCAPLYDPTFDQIYTRTLKPTCALSGASCHASEGQMGGLAFADADSAYAALLGEGGAKPRVVAGDAACSLLIERLDATDSKVMPPGAPLADAERCAVAKWIQDGAKR
ncbi:MAG: c-type cytochrome domain-containing protein [Byssovorax sp.]